MLRLSHKAAQQRGTAGGKTAGGQGRRGRVCGHTSLRIGCSGPPCATPLRLRPISTSVPREADEYAGKAYIVRTPCASAHLSASLNFKRPTRRGLAAYNHQRIARRLPSLKCCRGAYRIFYYGCEHLHSQSRYCSASTPRVLRLAWLLHSAAGCCVEACHHCSSVSARVCACSCVAALACTCAVRSKVSRLLFFITHANRGRVQTLPPPARLMNDCSAPGRNDAVLARNDRQTS